MDCVCFDVKGREPVLVDAVRVFWQAFLFKFGSNTNRFDPVEFADVSAPVERGFLAEGEAVEREAAEEEEGRGPREGRVLEAERKVRVASVDRQRVALQEFDEVSDRYRIRAEGPISAEFPESLKEIEVKKVQGATPTSNIWKLGLHLQQKCVS